MRRNRLKQPHEDKIGRGTRRRSRTFKGLGCMDEEFCFRNLYIFYAEGYTDNFVFWSLMAFPPKEALGHEPDTWLLWSLYALSFL